MSDQHTVEPEQSGGFPLSPEELCEAIKKTMTKDCKIDACIDKFFSQLLDLPGIELYCPWRDYCQRDVDQDQLAMIKDTLLADLDNLVPEYDEEELPKPVTTEDKFKFLSDKLASRWEQWYTLVTDDDEIYQKLRSAFVWEIKPEDLAEIAANSDSEEKMDSSLFDGLKDIIQENQSKAVFTCGGSIAIARSQNKRNPLRQSPPITFYWSSEDATLHRTLMPEGHSSNSFQQLVKDCSPATFGLGQKDVLDTSYRHAGKLDADRFCSTFHPADFGILDSIEQTLLPNINSSQENTLEFRRVRAELYKLNIYSGPSGLFRAHVDTPRSPDQFGSLVVCLPSSHEGGTLIVRHQGKSVEFVWDNASSSHIQWAAFYSDCEHEIERVTKGYRMTLTYNLYVTEPVGGCLLPNPLVEPRSFPVYGEMKSLLQNPEFMNEG
ncbi:predicted protein [Uncinocarpus reesii 1704]|uniref:Fe2OG dioxygenase domain-containing protein n=1 Tax=Uncinocarpus reesii (strain UAMH 1704) TaxID=336963 RepID=C4JW17_UNCRE|nr:uncharacterized protein UREG_06759 [Uncinocarpus reesii 1704]EEP81894.1 predicted protein [Uncinocarpus reesii 1704]